MNHYYSMLVWYVDQSLYPKDQWNSFIITLLLNIFPEEILKTAFVFQSF